MVVWTAPPVPPSATKALPRSARAVIVSRRLPSAANNPALIAAARCRNAALSGASPAKRASGFQRHGDAVVSMNSAALLRKKPSIPAPGASRAATSAIAASGPSPKGNRPSTRLHRSSTPRCQAWVSGLVSPSVRADEVCASTSSTICSTTAGACRSARIEAARSCTDIRRASPFASSRSIAPNATFRAANRLAISAIRPCSTNWIIAANSAAMRTCWSCGRRRSSPPASAQTCRSNCSSGELASDRRPDTSTACAVSAKGRTCRSAR